MSNSNTSEKDGRSRAWTMMVYPTEIDQEGEITGGAPLNWREVLDEFHVEWVESPLHDKDVNPTGEPKKAHWHVLVMFGGLKSYEQTMEIARALNANTVKRVHNVRSLIRYMAHMDNPEKAPYDQSKIVAHGGVDLADLTKPSSSERYTCISEMRAFVRSNNIVEFQDLLDYADENRHDDWFPLLCDSCVLIMNSYIKSQRHRQTCK